MAKKTTVTLPDDLHARWKAAGIPITEVVRRGLDGTGDTARHTAAETRLAGIEGRIALLEIRATAAAFPAGNGGLDDGEVVRGAPLPTAEELEQREAAAEQLQADRDGRRARRWAVQLAARPEAVPGTGYTAPEAAAAWNSSVTSARDRLHKLAVLGHASISGTGSGQDPYRWKLTGMSSVMPT